MQPCSKIYYSIAS